MALRLQVDVGRLVIAYLLTITEVTAIVSNRIGNVLYAGSGPAVQVNDITGDELVPRHLDAAHLQVDAWGGNRAQSLDLARTVRAALLEMPAATVTALHTVPVPSWATGVATDVATLTRPRWLPDDSVNPPRPRFSGDYQVIAHPLP